MKIIRTIESFYPKVTGPANQAYKISSMLEQNNIESPVFTTNFDVENAAGEERIGNVNVKRFNVTSKILKYINSPDMKKALEEEEFEVVHAHCYRSKQSEIGFRIAKKKQKPFVISTHGTLLSYKHFVGIPWRAAYSGYDALTSKRCIKEADAVVVNSTQEYAEALSFGVDEKRLHLIPVGIDIEKYKTDRIFDDKEKIKNNNQTEPLRLLYVGRITRNRPLEHVIDAVKIIKEEHKKNIRLTIIGNEARSSHSDKKGYIDELKEKVNAKLLGGEIEFLGRKEKDELRAYYKLAEVFIYPSKYESFGQPILEAAASGLPIICSNVGVARDLIKNNENGFIMNNIPKIIAFKLLKLYDPTVRESFSSITSVIVEEKYSWEKIIERYVELYEKLIAEKIRNENSSNELKEFNEAED